MSRLRLLAISLALGLMTAGPAAAQAAAEAGLGAARAATTTAPAAEAGKAFNGLAASLDKALKAGQQSSAAPPVTATSVGSTAKTPLSAQMAAIPAAAKWADPSGIEKGIRYDDLIHQFGPPALEISSEDGRSLTYKGKDGTYRIEVQDEKVTAIRAPKS
jgi:hypothetical protein